MRCVVVDFYIDDWMKGRLVEKKVEKKIVWVLIERGCVQMCR